MARNYILIENGEGNLDGPGPYTISFTAPFEGPPALTVTAQPNINVWIESITATQAQFSLSGYDASYMTGQGYFWRAIYSKLK